MKNTILLAILLFPVLSLAQNTIGGNKVIVPEAEVDRQSKFLDAERERILLHFDKAVPLYKDFLLENPTNDAAWYGLSRCFAAQKDDNNALDAIRSAIAADGQNPWYQVFHADLLERNGRTKDAVKIYETLVKQNPQTPAFYERLAYLSVLSGDPKGGLKVLEKLENLTGVSEETAGKKHMIYVGLGDNKKAAAELQKLADAFPEDIEHRRRLAVFLDETGDKAAAQKAWQTILKMNPDDPVAKIAVLDQAKGSSDATFLQSLKPLFRDPKVSIDAKIKEILPYFEKLNTNPDPATTQQLLELGALLENTHPDEAKAWSLSGDLLYHANQPTAALEKYRRCIALNGTVFSVWQNTLDILAAQKNFPEMFKTAEKALDAFPNQARAYYYFGVAAVETNQLDDAIIQLEQATLMAGNNLSLRLDVTSELGRAFLKKKDFAEAKNRLEASLTKGGDKHPGVLETLGDAHFQLGNGAKAVEFWQKANAIRKSPALEQKISSGKM